MMTAATFSLAASRGRESPSRRHALSNATPIALVVSGSNARDCSYGVIGIFPPIVVVRRPPTSLAAGLAGPRRDGRLPPAGAPQRFVFGRVLIVLRQAPVPRRAHGTDDTRWRNADVRRGMRHRGACAVCALVHKRRPFFCLSIRRGARWRR
jgi:hypothetical protein